MENELGFLSQMFDTLYLFPEELEDIEIPEEELAKINGDQIEKKEESPKNEVKEQKAVPKKSINKTLPTDYYGENKRHIVILIEHSGVDIYRSKEFQLLLKIIGALQLSLQEVAVVNVLEQKDQLDQLMKKLEPKHLLYFINGDESPISSQKVPKYVPTEIDDCPAVAADSLSKLLFDTEKKKDLWLSLKTLFDL
ncbi:hypothetical protein MY04_0546 [Flammeovirga sp. MY04]|uniref:hypothetical protein n=1 Tax=Flammeovirga sp. MY04 TaxID=1191459 RepID=UPI00080622C0|nr:hypothetical protein [Flammeovirga sp. MY04]ANQ47928.1 hypothetical protein MY04_0546 [Flammeovirga sp. MY04]